MYNIIKKPPLICTPVRINLQHLPLKLLVQKQKNFESFKYLPNYPVSDNHHGSR
jgi:hypothetical protein